MSKQHYRDDRYRDDERRHGRDYQRSEREQWQGRPQYGRPDEHPYRDQPTGRRGYEPFPPDEQGNYRRQGDYGPAYRSYGGWIGREEEYAHSGSRGSEPDWAEREGHYSSLQNQAPRGGVEHWGGSFFGSPGSASSTSRSGMEDEGRGYESPGQRKFAGYEEMGDASGHQTYHDPDYLQWRREQMRNLDRDYAEWRKERYKKFSEDFDQWRRARAGGSQGMKTESASQNPATSASSSEEGNSAASGSMGSPSPSSIKPSNLGS
jgi:hypothetical protein